MPLGVVYKIASSKGLIKPVPNPESKAIGTKLEEYCINARTRSGRL